MRKKVFGIFFVVVFAIVSVAYLTDRSVWKAYLRQQVLETTVGYMHHIDEAVYQTTSSIIHFEECEKTMLRKLLTDDSRAVVNMIVDYDSLVERGLLSRKEAQKEFLSRLREYKVRRGEDLFVFDENGKMVYSVGEPGVLKFGSVFLNKDYFYRGKRYSMGWSVYPSWGWKVVAIVCHDDIGLIFPAGFKEKMKKVLIERIIAYPSRTYLVAVYNDEGKVIAHSYKILGKDDLPGSSVMKRVFSQKYGYFFYSAGGVEKLKVFSYYPVLGNYVVLTAYPSREFMPVLLGSLKKELLPLIGIVALGAVLLLLFFNRAILRPLLALKEGFERLKDRRLGYHIRVRATDEMKEVIDGFNEMSDELRMYYDELEAAYGELEAVNSELEKNQLELVKERNRLRIAVEIANRSVAVEDKKAIAEVVVEILKKERNYENIDVSLVEDGYLVPVAFADYRVDAYKKMPVSVGVRGWAVTTKELKNVPDVSKEPHYFEGDPRIRSEICCPIIYDDEVMGVVDVESDEPAAFDEDDEWLFRIIARYLAVAFKKAELLEGWKKRTGELGFVLDVIKSISKSDSVDDVARLVIGRLVDEKGYRNATFYVIAGEKLIMICCHGYELPADGSMPSWAELDIDGKGIIARAARLKQIQNVENVLEDPDYIEGDPRVRSELAVPVLLDGELVGVLDVEDVRFGRFGPEDESFISTLADAIAVVVHKASMLEELEASLGQIESYAQEIEEKSKELETAYLDTIRALSKAIEMKDPYTRGHSERVALLSVRIADALGLSEEKKKTLLYAALLHDVGKIGIKGVILDKNGKLTYEEYEHIKRHPVIGANILREVKYLRSVVPLVLHHHERWDGKGYPDGLKGEEIPLLSRIIAVADTYDAMTSDRPYRKAFSREEAIKEIEACAGTQFDPQIVSVFLKLV